MLDAFFLPLAYAANKLRRVVIHDVPALVTLWLRGEISDAALADNLASHGYSDGRIEQIKKLVDYLL